MNKILIALAFNPHPTKDTADTVRCKDSVEAALREKGYETDVLYVAKEDFSEKGKKLIDKISTRPEACIFNLFEGFSDDPLKEVDFIKILEQASIPFTGNSSYTLATCLNKHLTKSLLREAGVPTPDWIFVEKESDIKLGNLKFPLFIKPCFQDASVGIDEDSFIKSEDELFDVISRKLKRYPRGLLISEFISGNEYNVGFLGNDAHEAMGISAIDYSKYKHLPHYLSYVGKWDETSEEFKKIIPDPHYPLDEAKKDLIIKTAQRASGLLKCRGYFRVDMREENSRIYVIDANPNPDINTDSGFMKQAATRGYNFSFVVDKIVKLALPKTP